MTRLTFNQIFQNFTVKGYTLHKLTKGYECFVNGVANKFPNLQSASDWLETITTPAQPTSVETEVTNVKTEEITTLTEPNGETTIITADEILEDDYGFVRTEKLVIAGLSVKIDCYEYGYIPFVAWNGTDFESVETNKVSGSLTTLKAELTELINHFSTSELQVKPVIIGNLSVPENSIYPVENLCCPHCGFIHVDMDFWALKLHKTHLCLECGELFEGSMKAVSHPMLNQDWVLENLERLPDEFYIEDVEYLLQYKDSKIVATPLVIANGEIVWLCVVNDKYPCTQDFPTPKEALNYGCQIVDNY